MDNIDLIRSAKLLVEKLGREGAVQRAKLRESELMDAEDHAGAAAWRLILRYIEEIEIDGPKAQTVQ